MYIPTHFDANEQLKIRSFLKDNTFGELISESNGKTIGTHAPFLISDDLSTVKLHIARANPQWQSIDGQEVLIIINGPHGYISPSWYEDGGVPTWNYQAVHLYGKASSTADPEFLRTVVNQLTSAEESQFEEPWQTNYPDSMLRGIVGIEIAVDDIQCKFKLSQNRSEAEQQNVAKHLDQLGQANLAAAMRRENEPT